MIAALFIGLAVVAQSAPSGLAGDIDLVFNFEGMTPRLIMVDGGTQFQVYQPNPQSGFAIKRTNLPLSFEAPIVIDYGAFQHRLVAIPGPTRAAPYQVTLRDDPTVRCNDSGVVQITTDAQAADAVTAANASLHASRALKLNYCTNPVRRARLHIASRHGDCRLAERSLGFLVADLNLSLPGTEADRAYIQSCQRRVAALIANRIAPVAFALAVAPSAMTGRRDFVGAYEAISVLESAGQRADSYRDTLARLQSSPESPADDPVEAAPPKDEQPDEPR